jgi:hypothetical protein
MRAVNAVLRQTSCGLGARLRKGSAGYVREFDCAFDLILSVLRHDYARSEKNTVWFAGLSPG